MYVCFTSWHYVKPLNKLIIINSNVWLSLLQVTNFDSWGVRVMYVDETMQLINNCQWEKIQKLTSECEEQKLWRRKCEQ